MSGEPTRRRFLANVQAALAGGERLPHDPDYSLARLANPDADLIELFVLRATDSGMIVDRLERGQAADRIVELLGERSAESAIVSTEPIVEEFDVRGRLRAAGVEVFEEVDDDEKLFSAGAGVTGVSHAVAETGSLFLCSGGQSPRQASLVPPMHIAILEEDQIVPDLLDLASALGQFESELPAGMCLVTGPSKSADIELTLVKGVHGPGRQHVILVPPVQP